MGVGWGAYGADVVEVWMRGVLARCYDFGECVKGGGLFTELEGVDGWGGGANGEG